MDSLENRIKDFNADLIPLLAKYKLGLGAAIGFTQDGRVVAKPQLFDDVAPEPPGEKIESGLVKPE